MFNSRRQPLNGYYLGALLFFTIQRISIVLGRCLFLRLEEDYWRSPFLINFIGAKFEAGNETREKFWSDFFLRSVHTFS